MGCIDSFELVFKSEHHLNDAQVVHDTLVRSSRQLLFSFSIPYVPRTVCLHSSIEVTQNNRFVAISGHLNNLVYVLIDQMKTFFFIWIMAVGL